MAFGFAGFATPRLVLEIFFVIKLLLSGGEDEVRTAIDALENPILKFGHGTILRMKGEADAIRFPC